MAITVEECIKELKRRNEAMRLLLIDRLCAPEECCMVYPGCEGSCRDTDVEQMIRGKLAELDTTHAM